MRIVHFIAAIAVGLFYHVESVQAKLALDYLEELTENLVASPSLAEAKVRLVPLSNFLITGRTEAKAEAEVKGQGVVFGGPAVANTAVTTEQLGGLRSAPATVPEKTRILRVIAQLAYMGVHNTEGFDKVIYDAFEEASKSNVASEEEFATLPKKRQGAMHGILVRAAYNFMKFAISKHKAGVNTAIDSQIFKDWEREIQKGRDIQEGMGTRKDPGLFANYKNMSVFLKALELTPRNATKEQEKALQSKLVEFESKITPQQLSRYFSTFDPKETLKTFVTTAFKPDYSKDKFQPLKDELYKLEYGSQLNSKQSDHKMILTKLPTANGQVVKFVSWNSWARGSKNGFFQGNRDDFNNERIPANIERTRAQCKDNTFIALQEWTTSDFARLVSQLPNGYKATSRKAGSDNFVNAILYPSDRYEPEVTPDIVAFDALQWAISGSTPSNGNQTNRYLPMQFKDKLTGNSLLTVCVHLKWPSTAANIMGAVERFFASNLLENIVVLGDFNADLNGFVNNPTYKVMAALQDSSQSYNTNNPAQPNFKANDAIISKYVLPEPAAETDENKDEEDKKDQSDILKSSQQDLQQVSQNMTPDEYYRQFIRSYSERIKDPVLLGRMYYATKVLNKADIEQICNTNPGNDLDDQQWAIYHSLLLSHGFIDDHGIVIKVPQPLAPQQVHQLPQQQVQIGAGEMSASSSIMTWEYFWNNYGCNLAQNGAHAVYAAYTQGYIPIKGVQYIAAKPQNEQWTAYNEVLYKHGYLLDAQGNIISATA